MSRGPVIVFVVASLVLTAGGAWYFREALGRSLGRAIVEHAPPPLAGAVAAADGNAGAARAGDAAGTGTVYRWVDAEGVTHYDQSGGAGREAVALDPSRIQRLEDLAPPVKN